MQNGHYDSTFLDFIPIDDMPQTIAYNADDSISYIEAVSGTGTWRQSYTYTSGKLTGISAWVKQ
jgi:hypothetical protein